MTTTVALIAEAATKVSSVTADRLEVHIYAGTAQVIDVREADERSDSGWIPFAVHVPRGLLEFWADPASPSHRAELDPTAPTIVYCAAGQRSVLAAQTLTQLGYLDVTYLEGGIEHWKRTNKAVGGLAPWHATTTSPSQTKQG